MSRTRPQLAAGATAPALVAVLEDIAAWRTRTAGELDAAVAMIAEEERDVRRQVEEGKRRSAALGSLRREQEERLGKIDDEDLRRKRAGLREALAIDRALVEDRASRLGEALARRDAAMGAGLEDPQLAPVVAEFLHRRDEAAGLTSATDHPDRPSEPSRRRLAPYLDAARAPLPRIAVPPAGVGVIVSVDPPVGRPEALVVVLPVPWAVYSEGALRTEDLCTLLAYRMVAAVTVLVAELGAPEAPLRYADLQGSLALQVWLGDHLIEGDLRERALERIGGAAEVGVELEAAGVEVYALWLAPELLVEAAS